MKIDESSGVRSNMSRGYLRGKDQVYRYISFDQNMVHINRIYECYLMIQINLKTIKGGNDMNMQYL